MAGIVGGATLANLAYRAIVKWYKYYKHKKLQKDKDKAILIRITNYTSNHPSSNQVWDAIKRVFQLDPERKAQSISAITTEMLVKNPFQPDSNDLQSIATKIETVIFPFLPSNIPLQISIDSVTVDKNLKKSSSSLSILPQTIPIISIKIGNKK